MEAQSFQKKKKAKKQTNKLKTKKQKKTRAKLTLFGPFFQGIAINSNRSDLFLKNE